MAYRIVPAEPAHLAAAARLAADDRGGTPREWAERFAVDLERPDAAMLVAVSGALPDDRPEGSEPLAEQGILAYGRVARHEPDAAPTGYYLGGVQVRPDLRRQGIGRALTLARMDWVRPRAPELWYFANARNTASLAMHRALGFVEVTREFAFPGVTFEGGVGVLCRVTLR